jgi:predicted permease
VVGDVRQAVLVMLGAVALVLLIACANVANLLLSRAGVRQKEMAVRTALGARPGRVIRQLLTESVLLGVLGGAAGLVVAWASLYMVRTINPGNIPRMETIGINGGVLAFTFGVSILTGIVFGLAPALRVSRVDLNTSLKAGGRASQGDGGFTPGKHRLRSLLVVTELSLSLMLLIGAGLLIRSFARLSSVSPGFNPDRLITMRLAVAGPRYRPVPPARPVWQFYEQVAERVRRLPGVKSHGAVSVMPLTQTVSWGGMSIEGWTPDPVRSCRWTSASHRSTTSEPWKSRLSKGASSMIRTRRTCRPSSSSTRSSPIASGPAATPSASASAADRIGRGPPSSAWWDG